MLYTEHSSTEQVLNKRFVSSTVHVIGHSRKKLRIALFAIHANLNPVSQKFEIARWDAKGIAIALVVISLWALSLVVLLQTPISMPLIVLGIPLQTFLYTGLFITAHDAMHGTVSPKSPRLNAVIGALAVGLYALFSYRKLLASHMSHHAHPGAPGEDPDFHDGKSSGFWSWYAHFLFGYVTVWQILGMALVFNLLQHVVGLSVGHLLLFWVAPSLLSTIQLFYFGTFLPHRGQHTNRHNARSNAYGTMVSFLTCYHFGYHHEHHEYPWVPWWHLPTARRAALISEKPRASLP